MASIWINRQCAVLFVIDDDNEMLAAVQPNQDTRARKRADHPSWHPPRGLDISRLVLPDLFEGAEAAAPGVPVFKWSSARPAPRPRMGTLAGAEGPRRHAVCPHHHDRAGLQGSGVADGWVEVEDRRRKEMAVRKLGAADSRGARCLSI